MNLSDIIKGVAPVLAGALGPGGALAAAALEFIGSKLGVPAEQVQQTIAGMTPTDLVKMKQIDLDFQAEMGRQGISLQLAQIGVDQVEAASPSVFIAGWRPAVGWIGAVAMGYVTVVEPLLRFAAMVGFHYSGPFPVIDSSITMQMLTGILGLAAMHSFDKVKGTA